MTQLAAVTLVVAVNSNDKAQNPAPYSALRSSAAPLNLFVGPSGNDSNDGSRDQPFRTLAKAAEEAIQRNAIQKGGSITLLEGRYDWEDDEGLVDGLVGPSADNPFEIRADNTHESLLDGTDTLPPLSDWNKNGNKFCTQSGFHPSQEVKELWYTGLGYSSVTGGDAILGVHAQHPNVQGGDRDHPDAWPVPSAPDERDYPLEGSVWDKSARLANNNGEPTLGLLDADEVVLSPPPKCFKPDSYSLQGDRCTNGCQQITGSNVKKPSKKCPFDLPDCPERYHDAFVPHPDPANDNNDMNDCPSAFSTCDRDDQDATWPWCLDLHNIGYVLDTSGSIFDYSDGDGGEIYATACTDKKLLGPFPIVAHDTTQGKIYFNYTSLSVNHNHPAKQSSLWEGMTSCWKSREKIIDITNGEIQTDYFRTEQQPKYKVVAHAAFDNHYEWWHSGPGQELCVKVEESKSTSIQVKVKQRGSMLRLWESENVKVSGIRFFGTELHAESESNAGIGFSNTFDNIVAEYPDEIRLLPAALTNSILRYGKGYVKVSGDVKGSDKRPERCIFQNNLIEYADMGVELTDCAGADIMHNTVHHIYNGDAFQIYQHGCDCPSCSWDSGECRIEVSYNHIHNVGFNGHCDCSGIQTKFGVVREMQVHHNWIYSLPYHKGIRMDTGENGGKIYENMIWNAAKGAMIKGGTVEGHEIIQNTAFGSKDVDFSVLEYELGSGSTTPWKPYNTKSIVYNNAIDDWRDSGNRKCTEGHCVSSPGFALKAPKLNKPWKDRWEKCPKDGPIPCHSDWDNLSYWLEEFNEKTGEWELTGVSVNDPGCQSGPLGEYNTLHFGSCKEGGADWEQSGSWPEVHSMLQDTGNFDFRPKQNSFGKTLAGTGKWLDHFESNDIGAYPASGAHYNIPGRVETLASTPVPPNGAFSVQTDGDLMFLHGSNAVKHSIYVDKSFCSVAMVPPGDGSTVLLGSDNIFIPTNGLEAGSRYYWRVDTYQQDGGIKEGPIWCFDVEEFSSDSSGLSIPWNLRSNKSDCTLMNIEDHCDIGNTPTQSPIISTPTLPPSCEDDMTWRWKDKPDRSCSWVAKKPEERCEKTDSNGKAADFCLKSCGMCCVDDMDFRYEDDPMKSCLWVAEKPGKRCEKTDENGDEVVKEACPVTCETCP